MPSRFQVRRIVDERSGCAHLRRPRVRLDLDHVGAEEGEQVTAVGTGQTGVELEHPHTFERGTAALDGRVLGVRERSDQRTPAVQRTTRRRATPVGDHAGGRRGTADVVSASERMIPLEQPVKVIPTSASAS